MTATSPSATLELSNPLPILFAASPLLFLLLLALLGLMLSSYIKVATVLSILRIALGYNNFPTAIASGGLALALSFFIMFPTLNACWPSLTSLANAFSSSQAAGTAGATAIKDPLNDITEKWRYFLAANTSPEELQRFQDCARKLRNPALNIIEDESVSPAASQMRLLIPAFIVTELKEAFLAGLKILLPFLIIDIFVTIILAAIGLLQLNPTIVALPFKLLLFIMVDGWTTITTSLAYSYTTG